MAKLRLIYFNFAARAEVARLCLSLGGVEFEDYRIKREEWPGLKATVPFGQIPVLEVDGVMLAQSGAIARYSAKLAGLEPADAFKAAQVDMWSCFVDEISDLMTSTHRLPEDQRVAARQALLEGGVGERLKSLDEHLAGLPEGHFIAGIPSYTLADVSLFNFLCQLTAGHVDGIPTDLYDKYPAVKAFRIRFASLDKVKTYYTGRAEATGVSTYKNFTV